MNELKVFARVETDEPQQSPDLVSPKLPHIRDEMVYATQPEGLRVPQHPHNGHKHVQIEELVVGEPSQLLDASFERVSVPGEQALDFDSTRANQAAFVGSPPLLEIYF